jgi:hypothetical protein
MVRAKKRAARLQNDVEQFPAMDGVGWRPHIVMSADQGRARARPAPRCTFLVSAAMGIALAGLAWALSGVAPVLAQANGVPDEKTLEDELTKKKPVTPKPAPKPVKRTAPANAPSEAPKPAPARTPILLIVESDAACTLEVNGDPIAALELGAAKKLPVPPGDQLVKCVSTEEPSEVYSVVQTLKAGEQKVVEIALASRVEAVRQKRDAGTQRVAAEDTLWGKASAGGTAVDLQGYLDNYPDGRYVAQAKAALTELARRAEEDADWKQVVTSTRLAAVQSYIDKYPAGRHLDAAQQRLSVISRLPPRPILPFTLSEDVWEALENSAFYSDLPRRSHKVTIQMSVKMESQPPKGSSTSWTQVTTREIVPLGDRCVVLQTDTRRSEPNDAPSDVVDDYHCGALTLGTVANGTLVRTVSLSDVESFIADDQTLREKPPCELRSSVPANSFHVELTGAATRFGCGTGDYYFSDLGVWLYELGAMDPEKQQYIVPNPGYHFQSVTDGVEGGKTTTVYERYSWTTSN